MEDLRVYLGPIAEKLGVTVQAVSNKLNRRGLQILKHAGRRYITHKEMRALFNLDFGQNKVISLQIVKGGTGKTTISAHLGMVCHAYGARVLFVDSDQNANLTKYLLKGPVSHDKPVLSNVMFDEVNIKESLINIADGLDILPSHIHNSQIDELIRSTSFPLDRVLQIHLSKINSEYDVIIIDCPHSLGPLVGAIALSSDIVLSPLEQSIDSIEGYFLIKQNFDKIGKMFGREINSKVIFNMYKKGTNLSNEIKKELETHQLLKESYLGCLLHERQEIREARAGGASIFSKPSMTQPRIDIEKLMFTLFGLEKTFKSSYKSRSEHEVMANV